MSSCLKVNSKESQHCTRSTLHKWWPYEEHACGRYADGGSNLLIVYKGCATVQLIESTCNCTCRHWEKKSRLCSSCLKHVLQLPNKTNTQCSIGKVFPSFSIIPSLHMNNTPHNIKRSSSDFTIMKGLELLGKVSRKKVAVLLDFVQKRGAGGPCQIFLSPFHKCIFGQ